MAAERTSSSSDAMCCCWSSSQLPHASERRIRAPIASMHARRSEGSRGHVCSCPYSCPAELSSMPQRTSKPSYMSHAILRTARELPVLLLRWHMFEKSIS
eukprot:Amastigsp_a177628_61.p4 type:complete len:100 gc:universal Amastigsp_a177628_61:225-524(+)